MEIIGKTEKRRGRPATGRDPSVTIRLPSSLLTWIDNQAEWRGVGRSEMVRRLIEESRLGVPQNVSQIRTAYHEAGHAVMARALGFSITAATIKPDGERAGHVALDLKDMDLSDQLIICSDIMITMAGRAAERMILGFHHDDGGDKNDRRAIRRSQRLLTLPGTAPPKQPLTRFELHLVLEMLLQKTWDALASDLKKSVEKVATALLSSETLDQRQVDALIVATGEKIADVNRPGDLRLWSSDFERLLSMPYKRGQLPPPDFDLPR